MWVRYTYFSSLVCYVLLVESSMRNYFSPCTNFPTLDNLTRSEQAEWQMLKGGETGKVTNELGPAALNPLRGLHLIHWSMMAKFMSVSFFFAIPHSHYSVSFPAEEQRPCSMTKQAPPRLLCCWLTNTHPSYSVNRCLPSVWLHVPQLEIICEWFMNWEESQFSGFSVPPVLVPHFLLWIFWSFAILA